MCDVCQKTKKPKNQKTKKTKKTKTQEQEQPFLYTHFGVVNIPKIESIFKYLNTSTSLSSDILFKFSSCLKSNGE